MPNSDFLMALSLEESRQLVNAKAATPNRRFEFKKRSQLLIHPHNETLTIAAMRFSDEVQVGKTGSNLNINFRLNSLRLNSDRSRLFRRGHTPENR